jgi:hypothetical protein
MKRIKLSLQAARIDFYLTLSMNISPFTLHSMPRETRNTISESV